MAVRSLVGWLALVVVGMGCASPTRPAAADRVTGIWTGTASDDESGRGTARLELVQASAAGGVSGVYLATFADAGNVEATVSGTVIGAVATLVLTPDAPIDCGGGLVLRGVLAATLVAAGDRLSGQYSGFTCGGARSGTLDLTRGE